MGVVLYKPDGQTIIVPPDRLQANLSSGWSLTKDIPEENKMEPKKVRALAKLHGLEDWNTARLASLRKRLGHE